MDGADDSIHAINASYYKDEESIYYKEGCCNLVKLEDLEISDFEIVDSKFPAYAKGKKKYYYKGKVIEKSSTKRYMKFTILNDLYAKDRVRVYYKGEKHPIASASNLKLKKGKISDYFFQYDAEGKVVLRSIKNLKGFNKILTLDPENMEVLAHRAKFLYRKKEFAKALSDFNRVLEATPENTDLLLKRGRCYEQLGQSEKALADYRLVLKSNPNDYSVNILVTGALIMMKQLDEAKKSAAQAKKVKPSDYQPLVYLGHISFLQSKDETAKKHYRQAMKNMDFKEELKSTIQNDLYVFMKKIWRPQEAYNIVQWTNSYWSKHHGNDGW